MWLVTEGEGEGFRRRISSNSSAAIWVFLPHCRFVARPSCSSSFRFLVRVRLRWKRLWRPERDGRGLGDRDQDSVSEDGGRTVRVGTGMGWVRARPCGPRGEDMVILTPLQSSSFWAVRRRQLVTSFSQRPVHYWHPPEILAFSVLETQSKHFKLKLFDWSLTQVKSSIFPPWYHGNHSPDNCAAGSLLQWRSQWLKPSGNPWLGQGLTKTLQPLLQHFSTLLPPAVIKLVLCIIRLIRQRHISGWMRLPEGLKKRQEQILCIQIASLHMNTSLPPGLSSIDVKIFFFFIIILSYLWGYLIRLFEDFEIWYDNDEVLM